VTRTRSERRGEAPRVERGEGLSVDKAAKVAYFGRRWWRNSGKLIHIGFPISYFDQLGVPRLAA
jgi:hypothetical protein